MLPDVNGVSTMTVKDLQSHSAPYVTVAELAEYWLVDRRQIYKQIDAGICPPSGLVNACCESARRMRERSSEVPKWAVSRES